MLVPPLSGPFPQLVRRTDEQELIWHAAHLTPQLDIPAPSGIVGKSGDRVSRRRPLRAPGDRSPICDGAIDAGEITGDRLAGLAGLPPLLQCDTGLAGGLGRPRWNETRRSLFCLLRTQRGTTLSVLALLSAASGRCSLCATRESESETFQMSRCCCVQFSRHDTAGLQGCDGPSLQD